MGDAYGEYGVMKTFLQENRFFLIPKELVPGCTMDAAGVLNSYSGWPATALLGSIVTRVCGINHFYTALALPWAFFLNWLSFVYLLLKKLEYDLNLGKSATVFALLAIATSPFAFILPMFIHSLLAPSFLPIFFYLMYKRLKIPSAKYSALLIILIATLVITHHYTSFIMVVYMLSFSTGLYATKLYISRKKPILRGTQACASFLTLGFLMFVVLFLWWNNYAVVIWGTASSYIVRFTEVLREGAFELYLFQDYAINTPACLVPPWVQPMLLVRNLTMYVPIVLGFIILLRQRKVDVLPRFFVLYSAFFAGVVLMVDSLAVWAGPYRALFLFMPFLALCIGAFYDNTLNIRSKWKFVSHGLILVIVTLWVVSSFTGLWANRYAPTHLYDPKVSFAEAGEHPVSWQRLGPFFEEHLEYENIDKILTDEGYALSLLLPLEQWNKSRIIGFSGARVSDSSSIVVAFRDLHIKDTYLNQLREVYRDPKYNEAEFRREVKMGCNLIYNDAAYQIWSHVVEPSGELL